ncbi:MAG: SH3 domain-containing protein [bacterium]|nr:SH3 domain-containing protein [bacterium]
MPPTVWDTPGPAVNVMDGGRADGLRDEHLAVAVVNGGKADDLRDAEGTGGPDPQQAGCKAGKRESGEGPSCRGPDPRRARVSATHRAQVRARQRVPYSPWRNCLPAAETDLMGLFRWFSVVVVAFVLAGTAPVLAQDMPDEATRARVSDWIERCPAPSDACGPVMRRIEDTSLLGSWCLAIDVQWDTARLVRDPAAILLFISECVPIIAAALDEAGEGDDGAGEAGYRGPVEPVDRVMQAVKRSNLRSGPGTTYGKVGLLDVGDEVRVTGEAGDWLRIEAPGGGEAFVHAPLLAEAADAAALDDGQVFETTNALEPACTSELPEGSGCWQELTERPGCHIWVGYLLHFVEYTTWSGACLDGKTSGQGTLTAQGGGDGVFEGGMRGGKFHGYGTTRFDDGTVGEGTYVDGKAHGHWVSRFADGDVSEGPYVDDKRHGQWVWRFANGNVFEGPYVDDKRHGQWVERFADGAVHEGPYVDGRQHGQWVERSADGFVFEGPFVDGKRHGQWVMRHADGTVREASYVDGERHGQWVERYPDGDRLEEVVDAPSEQAPHAQDSAEGQPTGAATATSAADSAGSEAHAGVSQNGSGATVASTPRLPVDATHCVKLHEEQRIPLEDSVSDSSGGHQLIYRFNTIWRTYENNCAEPIILRTRHFDKYRATGVQSYVQDSIYPGKYKRDNWEQGHYLQINNLEAFGVETSDHDLQATYPPLSEVAYCAEFVDTETTPEYLSDARYRLYDTSTAEFGSYSGVVDHLRSQGRKVGPEMRAYYDTYFESLEHSPCYAEVVREPPNGYEHFPPLDRYEVGRMSTFVTFHKRGGGFEALSFDEEADFGGASFHDVGGTDTHYVSDLPTPRVGRNE